MKKKEELTEMSELTKSIHSIIFRTLLDAGYTASSLRFSPVNLVHEIMDAVEKARFDKSECDLEHENIKGELYEYLYCPRCGVRLKKEEEGGAN